MESTKAFRTKVFGGYNKEDVDAYIGKMEAELAKLQQLKTNDADMKVVEDSITQIQKLLGEKDALLKENDELKKQTELSAQPSTQSEEAELASNQLLEENVQLRAEIQKMKDGFKRYEEDHDAISKVLWDARINANVILTKANTQAEKILEDAKEQAIQKKKEASLEFQKELNNKVIEFTTIKYKLADYINGIEESYARLGEVAGKLKDISTSIPSNWDYLIEGEMEEKGGSQITDKSMEAVPNETSLETGAEEALKDEPKKEQKAEKAEEQREE